MYFNEPLSMLQRMLEVMKNEDLMDQAVMQKDSMLRLIYVAAFWVTQY